MWGLRRWDDRSSGDGHFTPSATVGYSGLADTSDDSPLLLPMLISRLTLCLACSYLLTKSAKTCKDVC
ncbi:hypothetical protein LIA77_00235 [Sarocladium implicatum]|nr:hypothetical protein LIA77_00235 [Sarocladium implicatum]